MNGLAVHGEPGASDAIGVSAHGSAQEGTAGVVAVAIVKAQDHISRISLSIGDKELHQGGTVVGDGGCDGAEGNGVQVGVFAGGQGAK